MYVAFPINTMVDLERIRSEIDAWNQRYNIRFTQKTVKNTHRLAFDHAENYTLFFMTWSGSRYDIVNVDSY